MVEDEHHDAEDNTSKDTPEQTVMKISKLISEGANSFLY